MATLFRFIYEFFSIMFGGIGIIFEGLIDGFKGIFSIDRYKKLISMYASELHMSETVLTVIILVIVFIIVALIAFILITVIKKFLRFRKEAFNNESLLEEIDVLNNRVEDLVKENQKILEIQSGVAVDENGHPVDKDGKPLPEGETPEEENAEEEGATDAKQSVEDIARHMENVPEDSKRFPQLFRLDYENLNTKIEDYHNTQTLEQLLDDFRCFSAGQLHLYYDASLLRVFFAGLACGKMIILQGISGTGKTSLAYAWSKFNKSDPCISSVQPSWRDRTDFFGYINDFTKKFTETPALIELYSALFDDRIHTIVLDEMNLARVEYYFAEVLSILEMPDRNEWNIQLVSSYDENDPKKFHNGNLHLNGNVWYIGTINNDDSTFMVTDKVYDRAMPIDINTKVDPFECREQKAVDLNSAYLDKLFAQAVVERKISDASLKKVEEVDNYLINHLKVSFGNRIMKQLKTFVPVYVASGGDEVAGIDYFICKKILRKLEQQNLFYIKDQFDPFIKFLDEQFGEGKMKECTEYIQMLSKVE